MTMMNNNNNNNNVGQFGDTTLTKVFVGGLAWETPKDALREHFEKYGEILEAVIISDKLSGKSKGYGFVTFKEAEAAKKACEDSTTLIINGRRANCNLAFLGARRPKSSSIASPPKPQACGSEIVMPLAEGSNGGGPRNNNTSGAPANHVQRYYPVGTPASPFHHHAFPFYGYTPTYIVSTDVNYNYNQKLCYGSDMNGHHIQMYPRQGINIMGGSTLMPMYPIYHPTETIGVPPHFYYQTATPHFGPVLPTTPIMSKSTSITPHIATGKVV